MLLENYFFSVVENIKEAIIAIDKDENVFFINKMAEYILNRKTEECIGKKVDECIPEIKLSGMLFNPENEIRKKFLVGGKELIANKILIKEKGEIQGAVIILRDNSYQKKLEKQIDDNKTYIEMLDTIMNTFNEWVVVTDEKGIITMMSKAYKEFLGCENPEGKPVEDVIENTRMTKVLESGVAELGDVQEIKGNKMIAMRAPLKKDGKIIGAIAKCVFKDISDFHFLSKKLNTLEKEVEFYKGELAKERKSFFSMDDIIGQSNKIREVKELSKKVAHTDSNVLIIGDSGTGKELIAHAIHNLSKRYLGPFVKINCAAIPSELLEAELFGYEEGAFTGAKKGGKKGKFELANHGTIFLDEIGDMPMNMQVKILRVIQEKEVERVGSNTLKAIDVRIIAATNKNIENSIKEGTFREDLYYRLNVMKITIPPLRERKEDIPELANYLRIKLSDRLGIYVEGISKNAMECLMNYDWPGNIRELENIIERAINLLDSDIIIKQEHLPERLLLGKYKRTNIKSTQLKNIIGEIEKEVINECLSENNWNKNKAAQILGISRAGLYKKIEEYKLENPA